MRGSEIWQPVQRHWHWRGPGRQLATAAVGVMLTALLAACAPAAGGGVYGPSGQAAATAVAPAAAPAVPTAAAPAAAPAVPTAAAPAAAGTPASAPAAKAAAIMLAKNDDLGQFLADDQGRALYLFTKDSKNTSNCYDQCAQAWPPLFTDGVPQGGAGVDPALLGTTTRKDGKLQATYNGWPLYYYVKDQKVGDVTGEEVGDVWYVVSAKGDKVEKPSAAKLTVAKNDTLGQFIADDEGRSLYLYTKDSKGTSNCYDKCAEAWPPLFTTGAPTGGDGVDAALLGTTTRKDGKVQVTYNGWPLYYWVKDQKAGDVTGQDVGHVWYVVSPKGDQIGGAPAAAATTPAAQAKPTQAAGQAAGQVVKVSIKDFGFGAPLTIKVGTTVEWVNEDSAAHTVTADGGAFDSGNLAQGATFKFMFAQAGTFNYYCKYHGGPGGVGMAGKVIVTN